ncbi:MAG TPA: OmpA family protein [Bryobacteraceae bacterium]|nr:OmpA family protein [Bryobacteraceae bacterium]
MFSKRIGMTACLIAVLALAVAPAFGASSAKVKNKGVITFRSGDTLTVKTSEGDFTVTINSDTKIEHALGLTGLRKKQDSPEVLIPGLKLKFEGTSGAQETQVTATSITFDSDDLALAQVIQDALNPTAQEQARHAQEIAANKAATQANAAAIAATQEEVATTQKEVAANKSDIDEVARSTKKRFSEMGEVVTKDQYTVLFANGEYALTAEYKQGLKKLAQEALTYSKGWAISVAGYADSVGNAASNQVLSKQRAQAVVAYLLQDCGVPVGRIVAPGAMGESNPAASNESPSGRAENRRVDVKLLLNKGVASPN